MILATPPESVRDCESNIEMSAACRVFSELTFTRLWELTTPYSQGIQT